MEERPFVSTGQGRLIIVRIWSHSLQKVNEGIGQDEILHTSDEGERVTKIRLVAIFEPPIGEGS